MQRKDIEIFADLAIPEVMKNILPSYPYGGCATAWNRSRESQAILNDSSARACGKLHAN